MTTKFPPFLLSVCLLSLTVVLVPAATAQTVVNPSFEADAVPANNGNGTPSGWSGSGAIGINDAAGPIADNGSIPDGQKVAFISGAGSLKQTVSGFIVGLRYRVRFYENARSGPAQTLQVTVGGTVVSTHSVNAVGGGNPYTLQYTDLFTASATNLEIAFVASNTNASVLLDAVAVETLSTDGVSTFTPVAELPFGRVGHTSTLLPDATVLVAGGLREAIGSQAGETADCRLYDPATKSWRSTNPMKFPRQGHTATVSEGPRNFGSIFAPDAVFSKKVVVIGGRGSQPVPDLYMKQTEVYETATGTWDGAICSTSALATNSIYQHFGHTATAIPVPNLFGEPYQLSRILVWGGYYDQGGPGSFRQSDFYDLASNRWSTTEPQFSPQNPYPPERTAAALLSDRRVLFMGGTGEQGTPVTTSYIYRDFSGTGNHWTFTGPLAEARMGHTATTLLNGDVLVTGGIGAAGNLLATSERYNDGSQTWAPTGGAGAGWTAEYFRDAADGTHLVGRPVDTRTDSTINFNTAVGWPLNFGAVQSNQNFSVRWTGRLTAPVTGTYTFITTSDDGVRLKVNNQMLIDNWTDHGPTENTGTIALTAGQIYPIVLEYYQAGGGGVISLEYQAPGLARQIIPASQLLNSFLPRQDHTATLLPSGKVLIIGGKDAGGAPLASAQVYDPATGLWTNTSSLNTARYGHTATRLADGRVLIVGGRISSSAEPIRSVEICGAQIADIVVERPINAPISSGSTHDLGNTADPFSTSFVIRNPGPLPLGGISISIDGPNSSDFVVTRGPANSIPAYGTTQFVVRFAPGTPGPKTANLRILNDSHPALMKRAYAINFTGRLLSDTADADGDGISDAQEWRMRALGFDWQVRQPALAAAYFATATANGLYNQTQYNANYTAGQNAVLNDPNSYSLYSLSQVQALNADVPLLTRDPSTGRFKLTMGVRKTTSLTQPFVAFPMNQTGMTTVINAQGKLEFEFPATDNAAFFRVEAQ